MSKQAKMSRKTRRSLADTLRRYADLIWNEPERIESVNIRSHRDIDEMPSDGQYRNFQPGRYTTYTVTLVVRNL